MIIPKEVKSIIQNLQKAGFEAYIVGGCVRDFLLEKEPNDWDVTTDAKPEEIQKVFPNSFYENNFLTVTVRTGAKETETPRSGVKAQHKREASVAEVEITTYRLEAEYSDKRHPDEVKYAKTLKDDLSRRDFTINAMAMDAKKKVIDLFGGQDDLKNKIIKTVGNPEDRFNEDALRMLRAVRFATTLGFTIEKGTAEAIKKNCLGTPGVVEAISQERMRDEFVKIITSDDAAKGIELLEQESGS